MSDSTPIKETEIYSSDHDIHGIVKSDGDITKLFFKYNDNDIAIRIDHFMKSNMPLNDIVEAVIDAYIATHPAHIPNRKLQLHYWYIDEHENGKKYIRANGIVTGHTRLSDSTFIHSSPIQTFDVDFAIDFSLTD